MNLQQEYTFLLMQILAPVRGGLVSVLCVLQVGLSWARSTIASKVGSLEIGGREKEFGGRASIYAGGRYAYNTRPGDSPGQLPSFYLYSYTS